VPKTEKVEPSHVFVRFETMHALNLNGPELYIVVSPMWHDYHTDSSAKSIRDHLVPALVSTLKAWGGRIEKPIFDIDVDFMRGAGCSVDKQGVVIADW
jgi:hypothetical protein